MNPEEHAIWAAQEAHLMELLMAAVKIWGDPTQEEIDLLLTMVE